MKKALIIAGLASTMALTSAMPALAWRGIATEVTLSRMKSDTSSIKDNTRNTTSEVRNLRNDVREQSRLLMQALRMQTGEQSAYADKQIEAYKRITDAAQQNDTDRVRQQIRAQAESGQFDPNPDACLLLDLFRNGAPDGSNGGGGTYAGGIARDRYQDIGRLGAAGAARAMVDIETPVDGVDASERASTFLEHPSMNLDDPEIQEALVAFQIKLAGPIPMTPVPELELNTPEGVARQAAQNTRSTRQSIYDANIAMITNMSDTVLDGEQLRKMAEGTPYEGSREIKDEASELQALDVMTVRHYAPPASESGASASTGVVMQKLYQISAISARMQYLQLEIDRRNLMTQSAILAKMIENDGN